MAQVRTLTNLTDVIADDLARSDLTTAISQAVSDAIQYYQSERFWFSESRTVEFSTVASQMTYDSDDDDEIPTFISIDALWVVRSNSDVRELERIPIKQWEHLADGSASSGEPYFFAHFNEKIYLYPDPDAVYTIRFTGHQGALQDSTAALSFGIGGANEDDPHPYFRNAFELLRGHAKQLIYLHKLQDLEMAAAMEPAMNRALMALRRETGARMGRMQIVSTQF